MLLASAIRSGKLIPQRQWIRHVAGLRKEAGSIGLFSSRATAKKAIYSAFTAAVEARAKTAKGFGVLFSGGVDSSFIAFVLQQLGFDFKCFTVGLGGSRDLAAAQMAAKTLKLRLVSKTYAVADAEEIIAEAVKLLPTDDPVTIGIAATELAALKLAAANKVRILFSGLGSEEIFAGYQRHVLASDVNEECWRGLASMWKRDFLRDFRVASAFKATALTPFLDRKVIVSAMRARSEWKVSGGEKKLILREIAQTAGLPEEIAFRPKLAAQYGSGFDRALEILARKAGFKGKREYLSGLVL